MAEVIGKGVRFRFVSASSSGDPRQSYSSLGGPHAPIEPTPSVALYAPFRPRISGSDQGRLEARSAHPAPEERVSAVAEDRHRIMQKLGASDRARMDQYFTSVRQTELQMEAELQRPNIEAKVTIPDPPSRIWWPTTRHPTCR